MDFFKNLFSRFHKKQEQALPAPVSHDTPIDREIDAIYAVLVDLMGTEKLVIKAGKMKALGLLRSEDRCDRVLALQRILDEDPMISPAPKESQLPEVMELLSERVADLLARRNVEDHIEKKVNEKL